jgi:hypothetical protein
MGLPQKHHKTFDGLLKDLGAQLPISSYPAFPYIYHDKAAGSYGIGLWTQVPKELFIFNAHLPV